MSEDIVYVNQRALFFPALRDFCNTPPKDKLSYFQVAGQSDMHTSSLIKLSLGFVSH